MIRVVLDTNIILSSLLQPLGPPAKVMFLARLGFLQLCVTGPIYAEYEEVMRRPRFSRISASISPTLQFIRESGLWVRPLESLRVCKDPDDNIFVECAEQAGASWLVTGNVQDFPPQWRNTEIATPRSFLDRLTTEPKVE
jgi:uncharacterized protein